jgi:putative ABC transport system permease protein
MNLSLAPRWRKILGDARAARGRLVLLMAPMSLSVLAVTTLLVANSIVHRELPRSYLDTHPASAILRMDTVDDDLVRAVRMRPGIEAAQASAFMAAKMRAGEGKWLPISLMIVPDFAALEIDRFRRVSGAWPPPTGTILIERSGIELLGATEGQSVALETADGQQHRLTVAGTVHDEGQAPSTMELALYGYITPATMQTLDPGRRLDQLKIRVDNPHANATAIEAVARPLGVWLREQGHAVYLIDIPPPGEHPHQWQYDTVSLLLLSFSVLGLILEAILMAIVIAGLLAPQVRQIAVMKAIGARSGQIVALYLTLVTAVSAVAVALGLPLGIYLGYSLVDFLARILNVSIESHAFSWWVVPLSVMLGLLVPLIAALVPILAATRRTVRESIDDHGVILQGNRMPWTTKLLAALRTRDRIAHLALRNTMRRKARLLLTTSLLTVAGAIFLVGGNLLAVWQEVTARAAAERRYDIQVGFRKHHERNALMAVVRRVPGVRIADPMDTATAYLDRGDRLMVAKANRNLLPLRFTPPQTLLMSLPVVAGRWLEARDRDAIVLNTAASKELFPEIAVGDSVTLLINRQPITLRVVGIAVESFSRAAAYATPAVYDAMADEKGMSNGVRVAMMPGYTTRGVVDDLTKQLARAGMPLRYTVTNEDIQRSQDAHVYILVALLGVIILGAGTVGAIGLASALGTSVVERTREFGIMRALGARSGHVFRSVVTEALFIGVVSWVVAIGLSVPLTLLVMKLLKSVAQVPISLEWSQLAALAWLAVAVGVAAVASIYPARRAARLRVGEALAQV